MNLNSCENGIMNSGQNLVALVLMFFSIVIVVGYFSIGLPVWIMLIGNVMGVVASMMLKPYVNSGYN